MAFFTASEMRRRIDLALRHMEKLGLDWRRTRFGEYVRVLDAMAGAARLRSGRPSDELARLAFEAGAQLSQLQHAAAIWAVVDQEPLRSSLVKVLKGDPLDDKRGSVGRDTLLELAAASCCAEHGLTVNIAKDDADVTVEHPRFGKGAVECKRPESWETVARCLEDIGSQLKRRRDTGCGYGIAVIGADRIVGTAGGPILGVKNRWQEPRITRAFSEKLGQVMWNTSLDPGRNLFPWANIGISIISGNVRMGASRGLRPFFHFMSLRLGPSSLAAFQWEELLTEPSPRRWPPYQE
jgi:hypothetical protein